MGPDREEDSDRSTSSSRSIARSSSSSDVGAARASSAPCSSWSTARATSQAIIDESGLVEFEVGKALYGLVTAGFVHRIGKTQTADAGVSRERASEEHRNLGIAFYKTGMLDEALREFRRVLELREQRSRRALLRRARARAAGTSGTTRSPRSPRRRAAGREASRCFTISRTRSSSWVATTRRASRSTKRCGAAARTIRASRRRSASSSLRDRRSARRRRGVRRARVRCSARSRRRRRGSTTRPHRRAARRLRRAPRDPRRRASPRIRTPRRCSTISRPCSSGRGITTDARTTAERGVQEDAGLAAAAQESRRLHYRAARYDEALECYLRAVKINPELGGDVYLKLGNIRLTPSGARRSGPLLGARARARSRQRHRPHESRSRAPGVLMLDRAAPRATFAALTRKISVERGFGCASYKEKCLRRRIAVRMRARGVHTYDGLRADSRHGQGASTTGCSTR